MDLNWWIVVIIGCLALAGCIAIALLWPVGTEHRELRLLANTARLTRLPEYVRAERLRNLTTVVTITLLLVAVVAALIAAARPSGLPSSATRSDAGQPEDIMVCVAGPVTDPAAKAVLGYFADRVASFSTERIGLTSPNRRVVPMTRDYQYAAARFADYAGGDAAGFEPAVSYADYAESVEDVLAMCLSGFPSFDHKTAQRRSLIYVGPDLLRDPADPRPALFGASDVRELVDAAGVQVNAVLIGPAGDALPALARDTGGLSFSADSAAAAKVAEIRSHPPAPTATDDDSITKSAETPDIPVGVALLALVALALWPVVMRP